MEHVEQEHLASHCLRLWIVGPEPGAALVAVFPVAERGRVVAHQPADAVHALVHRLGPPAVLVWSENSFFLLCSSVLFIDIVH